jgi:hypothetical protein
MEGNGRKPIVQHHPFIYLCRLTGATKTCHDSQYLGSDYNQELKEYDSGMLTATQ